MKCGHDFSMLAFCLFGRHVWECLAEAYYKRGSYTAALKAFTKASEVNLHLSVYHGSLLKKRKGGIMIFLNFYNFQ